MSRRQEWDWPPERRPGRRRYQTIEAFPRRTGWASPTVVRIVDIYWKIVITMLKMVVGAFLGLALGGCVWMIVAFLSL